jgi:hypothetical protein
MSIGKFHPLLKFHRTLWTQNGLESNPNNDVVMNDVDGFVPVGDPKVGNDIHKPADNKKNSQENIVKK